MLHGTKELIRSHWNIKNVYSKFTYKPRTTIPKSFFIIYASYKKLSYFLLAQSSINVNKLEII